MKTVKITKNMLKMHPQDLLIKVGAANVAKKRAYPQHLYFSKEDFKELKSNLVKQAKKQYPGISKLRLDGAVGMALLNLGPNQSLEQAVRPGYALVDLEGIKEEK